MRIFGCGPMTFSEAPVEDLRHFAGLEVRFSVEGGVLRVREILEGTEP